MTTPTTVPTTTARWAPYGDASTDWATLGAETMLAREPVMNPHDKWEYEDGLMLGGVLAVHRLTGEPRYLEYVRRNLDHFVRPDGSIHGYRYDELNLDHVNNGKVVLDLYDATGDPRYRKAADLLFDQLRHQPRLASGTFWHKKIYPYQTWLDGLYMGSVFYARYCATFGREDLFDDVALQFTTAYDLTLDPASGLCRHAYDESRSMPWADPRTGWSPHAWLRALGWFVMAMTDVLEHLPASLPQRATILGNLRSLLGAVRGVADPRTGLWYQVPDQGGRPLNYLEASGSLMVLAAVAKGLRLGYLDDDWSGHLDHGWESAVAEFLSLTDRGWVNVNKVCQVAGLGGPAGRDGSYAYYMSEPVVANDHKGVGPFLLLAAEMRHRRPG